MSRGLLVGLLAPVLGCQLIVGIDDTKLAPDAAANDAGPDASAAGFTLHVVDTAVSAPIDGQNYLVVSIERVGGFSGEVTVDGKNLPSGMIVTPRSFGAGEAGGDVLIGAAAPLAIGDTVS